MIVISEFMDESAVEMLRRAHEVRYDPGLVDDAPALQHALTHARALIVRNRTAVTEALIAGAADLACVGRLGVGLDNIDLDACAARGIDVYPATGANTNAVAEYVVTTALMLLRGAYNVTEQMAAGQWPRMALSSGHELGGKVMGLIGFGGIAREVARLVSAFNVTCIAHDPYLPPQAQASVRMVDSLDTLLACSDVVSVHLPLNEGTRGLINAERLAAMKPGAVLINSARGGIVEEAALIAALQSGHLRGAAVDVFDTEPLPEAAAQHWRDVPGLILTPHIAGVTAQSNTRVSSLIATRILEHLA